MKELPEAIARETIELRKKAFEEIQETSAADTTTPTELELVRTDSDPDLIGELEASGSFFTLLRLNRYKHTKELGIVYDDRAFHDSHLLLVNHFIRGAQSSWKLDRLTSFESCLAPISAGDVYNELPDDIKVPGHETAKTVSTTTCENARKCGLGTRALLAKSRVGGLTHFPLYRLLKVTRPDEIDHINPCSENINRVSQTRRREALYKGATSLSMTKDQDQAVFSVLTEGYEPVARDK